MSLPPQQPAAQPYLLGHTPAAIQRLLTQGHLLNAFTRAVFEEAGLTTGMRVLDVGCGPGDVSLIAAELVGKTGRVLGVDANASALQVAQARAQEAGLTQVSFQVGDLLTLALEEDYDAIVGRLILMHLAEPATLLRRLTAHLRPGGVVVFQEYDLSSHTDAYYPPSSLWEQVWRLATQPFQRAGGELEMGMKLYGTFLAAGLPAPQLRYEAAIGTGPAWVGYEWWAETVRTFLPLAEQLGIITEEDVQIDTLAGRLREETVSRGGVARGPVLVSAWTRRSQNSPGGRTDARR